MPPSRKGNRQQQRRRAKQPGDQAGQLLERLGVRPDSILSLLACGLVAVLAIVVLASNGGGPGDWRREHTPQRPPPPPPPPPADPSEVVALVQRAAAADPTGWKRARQVPSLLKPEALTLWRQVLRLSPTDPDANKAVGMDYLAKDQNEECLPHLKVAVAANPEDYAVTGWYAGATSRANAKLPETESAHKQQLWSDAIATCDTAARTLAETRSGPSSERPPTASIHRFCFTHCCEIYQTLEQPDSEADCWRSAMANGVWQTEGQRPVNYDAALAARPWWTLSELGRSASHAQLLQTNWESIAREARHILGAGREHAGGTANGSAVADAAGFAIEKQGLHAQRSWHEFVLMTGGKRHLQNCKSAPFTCNLFASMPEVASTTVGDVKFSLMQPGTIVRPHTGPTNKRVRLHLGLDVPAGCCEITVGQEAREWADGELLIFDDSFEHSVAHTGESERLILIADVLHPQLEGTSGSHYAKPAE